MLNMFGPLYPHQLPEPQPMYTHTSTEDVTPVASLADIQAAIEDTVNIMPSNFKTSPEVFIAIYRDVLQAKLHEPYDLDVDDSMLE